MLKKIREAVRKGRKEKKEKIEKHSDRMRMETEVITAKLSGGYDELIEIIEPFATAVTKKEDFVLLEKTETLDIEGNPILFWKTAFTPTQIKISYSIPPGVSKKERELMIWRKIIKMLYLTTSKGVYYLDMSILQKFLHIIDESLDVFTTPYSRLRLRYEDGKTEINELRDENKKNREMLEEQSIELHRLRSENTTLRNRVSQLEGMSDKALMGLLLMHLKNNGGDISPVEFARQHKTSTARVEECLNMLIHNRNIKLIE